MIVAGSSRGGFGVAAPTAKPTLSSYVLQVFVAWHSTALHKKSTADCQLGVSERVCCPTSSALHVSRVAEVLLIS